MQVPTRNDYTEAKEADGKDRLIAQGADDGQNDKAALQQLSMERREAGEVHDGRIIAAEAG